MSKAKIQFGYALVELLVVMSIILILFSISTISVGNLERQSQIDLYASDVKSAIYEVQAKVLNGQELGIFFDSNKYILFSGSEYNPSSPENQTNLLPDGLVFASINLPNQQITFEKPSGSVSGYSSPQSVTLVEQATGKTKNISINEIGLVEIE